MYYFNLYIANDFKEDEHRLATGSLKKEVEVLKASLQKRNAEFEELEKDQEDLLICLADQDTELQDLRERLCKYEVV